VIGFNRAKEEALLFFLSIRISLKKWQFFNFGAVLTQIADLPVLYLFPGDGWVIFNGRDEIRSIEH
tara:strand:+ start:1275 stop:1472 length:198 start_codon:yes stop_codon:yes gene_type:complete